MPSLSPEQAQYMKDHIDDTKVPGLIAVGCSCLALSYIFVCLRFISRRIGKVKLAANDWLIVLALFFLTTDVLACLVAVRYKLGRHVIAVTNPKALIICVLTIECSAPFSYMAIKLSLLSLYCRIFPLMWIRNLSLWIALFIIINTVVIDFITIFQCVPIRAQWDSTIDAKCVNYVAAILARVITNLITDVIVLVLPIYPVWALQTSKTRKWQLSIMFTMGGLACIISFAKLFFARVFGSVDPPWDNIIFGQLHQLECSIGMIAACLPACRPLLKHLQRNSAFRKKKFNHSFIAIAGTKQYDNYALSAGISTGGTSN